MSDAKLFSRGKASDLKADLAMDRRDRHNRTKKLALKKIVANMTMSNNEMVTLFSDILACMTIDDLDVKKMCFLYLLTYAKAKPQLAIEAVPVLSRDLESESPLLRALALRTVSAVPVKEFFDLAVDATQRALADSDAYVRKTAAYAVPKLWSHGEKQVLQSALLPKLQSLVSDANPTVVAGALAALADISERSERADAVAATTLTVDGRRARALALALQDCNEWSQAYILNALMTHVPASATDAAALIELVSPRLKHQNSAVVLGAIRLILYFVNFVGGDIATAVPGLDRKLGPALAILLSKPAEIQYIVLRNCLLLLQSKPELVLLEASVFFCKYNDPIYVKATKLDILAQLASEDNISVVLRELQECASEIDVQVVRKAVAVIGRLAIRISSAADACIEVLLELVSTNVSYIVQEVTVVMRDVFRRYPNRFEAVIAPLCSNLASLDEPEARAALIWIVGHYADRIDNSDEILGSFLATFGEETPAVQLALLTAIMKLFILRPTRGKDMVPQVLKLAAEESDNPDLRDRGYFYWRLISADPSAARDVVLGVLPEISGQSERMDDETLEELELALGTLASVYLKPIRSLFRQAKSRQLPITASLAPRPKTVQLIRQNTTSGGRTMSPGAGMASATGLAALGSNNASTSSLTRPPPPPQRTTSTSGASSLQRRDTMMQMSDMVQTRRGVTQNGLSSVQQDLLW